jgi:hypothetical protein
MRSDIRHVLKINCFDFNFIKNGELTTIMIPQKFEDITRRIWTDINLSNRYNTLYGEETITDSILLELAKQNYFNIRILQTPKPLEATQGTDWEWYVGSYTYGWVRYAIQAKKLNPKSNTYDSLNHKVGQPPNDDFQINLLRTFANTNGAVPLYNFYNYFPTATAADHWQCSKTFDRELLGWTFTTLTNVETAISTRGWRTFDKIHHLKYTLPIRCLFTCPYFKSLYQDQSTIGSTGDFLGETFRKVAMLPRQFINAREIGTLDEFPEELYSPQIEIYPKRIAIIELPDDE